MADKGIAAGGAGPSTSAVGAGLCPEAAVDGPDAENEVPEVGDRREELARANSLYAGSESQRPTVCTPSASIAATWITAGWLSPPPAYAGILARSASYSAAVTPEA